MMSTNSLSRDWHFDASSSPFVADGATIRVLAVPAHEATLVKDQIEDLYRSLHERANDPIARAMNVVARAFQEASEATRPARIVLVYYDAKTDTPNDRLAAVTHVYYDGEHMNVAPIAVAYELPEDVQHSVLHATVSATEELVEIFTRNVLKHAPSAPVIVSRGQLGASEFVKNLFIQQGYSPTVLDRLIMTARLNPLDDVNAPIENCGIDGVEIRALDLATDDIQSVFSVVKEAFGPHLSLERWKRHYARQPRFASDLSFVAWHGTTAIAVALIELLIDGEGGGEEEVQIVCNEESSSDTPQLDGADLVYPDDCEERRQRIRSLATVGYVCGVATAAAFRGKRLAQTLVRHSLHAAARMGLQSIFLGTDSTNHPAVRAYTNAGMVVTERKNTGLYTGKIINSTP